MQWKRAQGFQGNASTLSTLRFAFSKPRWRKDKAEYNQVQAAVPECTPGQCSSAGQASGNDVQGLNDFDKMNKMNKINQMHRMNPLREKENRKNLPA